MLFIMKTSSCVHFYCCLMTHLVAYKSFGLVDVDMVVVVVVMIIGEVVVDSIAEVGDDIEVAYVDMSWNMSQMNLGMHYGIAYDSILMNWGVKCVNVRMYHHTGDRVYCNNNGFNMVH